MFDINKIPIYDTENVVCKSCATKNEYYTEQVGIQLKAICNHCDGYIKFIPQDKPQVIYFGKYKNTLISKLTDKQYIEWLFGSEVKLSKVLSNALRERWLQL